MLLAFLLFVYAFNICMGRTSPIILCSTEIMQTSLAPALIRLQHKLEILTCIICIWLRCSCILHTFSYILEHISWCNLSVAYAVIVNISFANFTYSASMPNLTWNLWSCGYLYFIVLSFIFSKVLHLWKWFWYSYDIIVLGFKQVITYLVIIILVA